MIFPVVVFGVFFVGMAFFSTRLLRMSDEELRGALQRSESQVGALGKLNRAPAGGLVAAALGFATALAVLVADHFGSPTAAFVAVGIALAWVIATAAMISAAYWGKPRWLVHPLLRDGWR
ncbi:MAG TPA: hypothetical protein VJM06_06580 [Gaiellaceae bacterium]|nr:hypothetical protein [Gaiellaceae bacterium]